MSYFRVGSEMTPSIFSSTITPSAMPDKKQSIVLGAVVAALLSTSYLGFINCLCCAGMIIAGALTVWHYASTNEMTIPAGQGAVMGLIAAIIGSFVAIFLNFILIKM
ncbi:MAG: hypothetical protein WD275_01835, partial [Rhodothermales bacterium]